jgi:hypothetical protein
MLKRRIGEKGVGLGDGGRQTRQVEMEATQKPRRIGLGIQGQPAPESFATTKASISLLLRSAGKASPASGEVIYAGAT